jgi:hypothetical protein
VTEGRLVAEAADAGAGPWPQRDAALDGGPEEAGRTGEGSASGSVGAVASAGSR